MDRRAEVRRWALDHAGSLALRELAFGMPGLGMSAKPVIVEWLLEHRADELERAMRLSERGFIHMAETRYSGVLGGFHWVCRCGEQGKAHDSRNQARREGQEHLDFRNAPVPE